jgi:predicted CopG family antitoxin
MLKENGINAPIEGVPEQDKSLSVERRFGQDILTLMREGDEAEANATEAKATAAVKYKAAGLKLIEAKAQVKSFAAFLEEIGLSRARAYELIAVAQGKAAVEEVRKNTNERKKRHRTKVAARKSEIAVEVEPKVSVPERTTKPSSSEHMLAEFKVAVQTYVSKLNPDDLQKAIKYFTEYVAGCITPTRH